MRVFSFLFALALLASMSSHAVASNQKWFDEYKQYVRKEAQKFNIPGYALVFYQLGEEPDIDTFGKTHQKGHAIRPETVFRLASVSKTFTAVMMSRWTTAHDISWQTSLPQLVSSKRWQQTRFNDLTLADIVGQSSGFMPNAYDNLIEADYSLDRTLNELSELAFLCQPGDCYTYQNALFGVLVEYFYRRDTSYHRQMHELVFSPLGMNQASVGKGGLVQSNSWARPHAAVTKTRWRETQVENNYYRFAPAAGVNASIQDMTAYLQALLGELPQVLSPEQIDTITTPRIRTTRERYRRGWRQYLKNAHYGLGWRVYDFDGHTINYHGGWVKGYRADVAFSPEFGVGFVMLMNAESNMINSATAEFWARFMSAQKKTDN